MGYTPLFLVISVDGDAMMQVGGVDDLAYALSNRTYGHDVEIVTVQALDDGRPVDVAWKTDWSGSYDENGLAAGVVNVTFPDGHDEAGHYLIDGNA